MMPRIIKKIVCLKYFLNTLELHTINPTTNIHYTNIKPVVSYVANDILEPCQKYKRGKSTTLNEKNIQNLINHYITQCLSLFDLSQG